MYLLAVNDVLILKLQLCQWFNLKMNPIILKFRFHFVISATMNYFLLRTNQDCH